MTRLPQVAEVAEQKTSAFSTFLAQRVRLERVAVGTLAGLLFAAQPRPPNLQAFSAVEGGGAAQTFGFDF